MLSLSVGDGQGYMIRTLGQTHSGDGINLYRYWTRADIDFYRYRTLVDLQHWSMDATYRMRGWPSTPTQSSVIFNNADVALLLSDDYQRWENTFRSVQSISYLIRTSI